MAGKRGRTETAQYPERSVALVIAGVVTLADAPDRPGGRDRHTTKRAFERDPTGPAILARPVFSPARCHVERKARITRTALVETRSSMGHRDAEDSRADAQVQLVATQATPMGCHGLLGAGTSAADEGWALWARLVRLAVMDDGSPINRAELTLIPCAVHMSGRHRNRAPSLYRPARIIYGRAVLVTRDFTPNGQYKPVTEDGAGAAPLCFEERIPVNMDACGSGKWCVGESIPRRHRRGPAGRVSRHQTARKQPISLALQCFADKQSLSGGTGRRRRLKISRRSPGVWVRFPPQAP
jgi:hypothetical protein